MKLEIAIENANRLLEELRAQKKETEEDPDAEAPEGFWRDSSGRLHRITKIGGNVNLGGIASNEGERQARVDPGEANASMSKDALALKADKQFKLLQDDYFKELSKCAQALREAGSAGTRRLDDGSIASVRRKGVQMPCPGADRARKALDAYLRNAYGRVGAGSGSNSGGGGGGGWF